MISKSASNQLNACIGWNILLRNEEGKALINSFVLSNILSSFLEWILGGETFY